MKVINPINPKETSLGKHLIAEFYNCCEDSIDNINFVRNAMLETARVAKATVVAEKFHKFYPVGVSGVVIISESHLSVHAWKEYKYCAVDIFVCDTSLKLDDAILYLKKQLKAKKVEYYTIARGENKRIELESLKEDNITLHSQSNHQSVKAHIIEEN